MVLDSKLSFSNIIHCKKNNFKIPPRTLVLKYICMFSYLNVINRYYFVENIFHIFHMFNFFNVYYIFKKD